MSKLFEKLQTTYDNWKEEAETFFVSKFIDSNSSGQPTKVQDIFKNCLDIIFNITNTTDSSKGIIAYNSAYGQGKTFFFDVTQHRFRRKKGRNLFVRTSAKELAKIYVDTGEDALLKFISCKNLFIDDIGDEGEKKVFKHYANEMNVLRWVILKRYEFWIDEEKEWKTYATTNLSKVQIAKEYDGRVADRLSQMCHWMEFSFLKGGKSFRQFSGTRKLTKEEVELQWRKLKNKKLSATDSSTDVDLIDWLNELISENEEYLNLNDWPRWNIVKPFMLERNLIDLDHIDEKTMDAAEMIALSEASTSARGSVKHAGEVLMLVKARQARDGVRRNDVNYYAELLLVKKAFLELAGKKYQFKKLEDGQK